MPEPSHHHQEPDQSAVQMKKIIALLLVLFPLMGQAQVLPDPMLELLIVNHKQTSNKLKERVESGGLKLGSAMIAKDEHLETTDVIKEVERRMGDLMSYAVFASDMLHITNLVKECGELELQAAELIIKNNIKYPNLVREGFLLEEDFGNMVSRITDECVYIVSAGLGVTMATQEQRQQFTSQIKGMLTEMRSRLKWYVYKSGVYDRFMGSSAQDKQKSLTEIFNKIQPELADKVKSSINL